MLYNKFMGKMAPRMLEQLNAYVVEKIHAVDDAGNVVLLSETNVSGTVSRRQWICGNAHSDMAVKFTDADKSDGKWKILFTVDNDGVEQEFSSVEQFDSAAMCHTFGKEVHVLEDDATFFNCPIRFAASHLKTFESLELSEECGISLLGDCAFNGMNDDVKLKNLAAQSVVKLGFEVFSGAQNLETIDLPNLETFEIADNPNVFGIHIPFSNCPKLKTVNIPKIESSAFDRYASELKFINGNCNVVCSDRTIVL